MEKGLPKFENKIWGLNLKKLDRFRKGFELKIIFSEKAVADLESIFENILDYSHSKEEAYYVVNSIEKSIDVLKNPFVSGSIPYSARIANLGYKQIPIVDGNYLVFFLTQIDKKLRIVDYIKPTKTNYENSIC